MWYFDSPQVVFGEEALSHLETLKGRQAFIVTDANVRRLGLVRPVQDHLTKAGIPSALFDEVEPDPSLQTVKRCAAAMAHHQPDWIVGLGGGSVIDAAKAAWLLYERPDVDPAGINPVEAFGLRAKARLIAIPTTSGTGSESTWAVVLTDTQEQRKLALGARELLPDLAIVDPCLALSQPPALTADTGLDALTHAVEGYTSTWRNDFSDGLCLKAIQLVMTYLPRAYANGADREAREHLHNAAAIAGLGFGNSMTALAHDLGHALGAVFHVPHGRAVSLCLPYTIEYTANAGGTRYAEIARFMHWPAYNEMEGAASLVAAIHDLRRQLDEPASIQALGIELEAFTAALPHLITNAELDTDIITSARQPDPDELRRLFLAMYAGDKIDF